MADYQTSKNILGKIPPQHVNSEQSVLGGILLDSEAMIKVVDIVEPSSFYKIEHQKIFAAMLELFEKRVPIDLITLNEQLEKTNELAAVGGSTYLSSLAASVSSSSNIDHYASIVKEKSVLRQLISAGSRITELGFEEERKLDSVLDESERTLFSVSQKSLKQKFSLIRDVLTDSIERIEHLHDNKGEIRGVPSGFKALDNLLAGFQKSDLIILAARPSMGKTTLALNIAESVAVESQKSIGIFSLEQSKEQLADSLLCSIGGIDAWRLRTGNLNEQDFANLNEAMGILSEAKLFIDDTPLLNITNIRAKARRLQMEHGLDIIIVDYLQLIEGHGRNNDNRVQEVSDISRALKALAREINVPVLALSQLSRAVESRPDKMPQLSDLRESGSIEQDADVVMFIYRDEYYHRETEKKGIADILIRKHRNGPVGDLQLFFRPEQRRFYDLDKR
ncbi:MAG: replicative DNA helicase [Berkelbacteria bacterium GW2011_GWA2_38_9]|uniref:Replicative DNA helicase n=1 Tax=Berkelbacteria bacterium GW2011_GWA2_38_9 TaxID=1618334 RepID=A0A0G0LQ94_9BACT|nr:MAG: replicative DNA helicase [Berkelbacteria bacterium GW2011_GWA2_38_9]